MYVREVKECINKALVRPIRIISNDFVFLSYIPYGELKGFAVFWGKDALFCLNKQQASSKYIELTKNYEEKINRKSKHRLY